MQIIGNQLDDLKLAKAYFKNLGATCKLVNLKKRIKNNVLPDVYDGIQSAYLLVVKKGADYLLRQSSTSCADDLYIKQEQLEKDKKHLCMDVL